MYGRTSEFNRLHVFGCDAYVYIGNEKRGKVDSRFWKGVFVGYNENQRGYRIMNAETRVVYISRDVKFDEQSFTGCITLTAYSTEGIRLTRVLSVTNPTILTASTITDTLTSGVPTSNYYSGLAEEINKEKEDSQPESQEWENQNQDEQGDESVDITIDSSELTPSITTTTDTHIPHPLHFEPTITRSGRASIRPYRSGMLGFTVNESVVAGLEPNTYKQATSSSESKQ